MDLTASIVPKSDQINAEDLLTGPRTFTITEVVEGNAEQPVNVRLAEMPGRPWRPSKSMRRVLVNAWGKDTTPYAGRRVTLYRDPDVTFGKDKVGGIKISHLSHIDKRTSVSLTVTRGKRAPHVVEPLPDVAPQPVAQAITTDTAARLDTMLTERGITDPAKQMAGIHNNITRRVRDKSELTEDEGRAVIAALEALPVIAPADEPTDLLGGQ